MVRGRPHVDVARVEQAQQALIQALPLATMGLLGLAGMLLWEYGTFLVPALLVALAALSGLLRVWVSGVAARRLAAHQDQVQSTRTELPN